MMAPFVELCAGRAAVSFMLEHSMRPAGSMIGSKAGYARTILHNMGLFPCDGAERYLWAEADPDRAAFLSLITSPESVRLAADLIASWEGRDPRETYNEMRKSPGAVGSPAWMAGYFIVSQWSYRRGCPESGFNTGLHVRREKNERGGHAANPRTFGQEASILRSAAARWPDVSVRSDARDVEPIPGSTVYIDPDYRGTTGYRRTLPRAAVIEIAQSWRDAGARVYISEAEPIAIPGWHHVEITGERQGQARVFGPTREWLTMSPQVGL